jgi:hypothetical protein
MRWGLSRGHSLCHSVSNVKTQQLSHDPRLQVARPHPCCACWLSRYRRSDYTFRYLQILFPFSDLKINHAPVLQWSWISPGKGKVALSATLQTLCTGGSAYHLRRAISPACQSSREAMLQSRPWPLPCASKKTGIRKTLSQELHDTGRPRAELQPTTFLASILCVSYSKSLECGSRVWVRVAWLSQCKPLSLNFFFSWHSLPLTFFLWKPVSFAKN